MEPNPYLSPTTYDLAHESSRIRGALRGRGPPLVVRRAAAGYPAGAPEARGHDRGQPLARRGERDRRPSRKPARWSAGLSGRTGRVAARDPARGVSAARGSRGGLRQRGPVSIGGLRPDHVARRPLSPGRRGGAGALRDAPMPSTGRPPDSPGPRVLVAFRRA